jgi:hypothetical protein
VARLAASTPNPLAAAYLEHARGLTAAEPVGHLEAALAAFARLSLPLEEARARLDLARAAARAGRAGAQQRSARYRSQRHRLADRPGAEGAGAARLTNRAEATAYAIRQGG